MYYDLIKKELIDLGEIKKRYANISFPSNIPDSFLKSLNLAEVVYLRYEGEIGEYQTISTTDVEVKNDIPYIREIIQDLSDLEIQRIKKTKFENKILDLIQIEVNKYNNLNGLTLKDVYVCRAYGETEGYTHQAFCKAIWLWNVQVWETARIILEEVTNGTREEPTLDEFLAELPEFTL